MHPPRFVQVRQRRYFRYGTAVVFFLAIGVLAACKTRPGQADQPPGAVHEPTHGFSAHDLRTSDAIRVVPSG